MKKTLMISFVTLLFILLFDVGSVYSQIVNLQPLLKSKTRNGFHLNVLGNFSWRTGNTELQKINTGVVSALKSDRQLFLANIEGTYAEEKEEKYINNYFAHVRYRYLLFGIFGIETFAQYEYDEFKRMDIRALWGAGPRLVLFTSDLLEVSFGSSYMPEYNKYSDESGLDDSNKKVTFHRWSNYVNFDITFNDKFGFFTTLYFQPRFDRFEDYRYLVDGTAELKLTDKLSFLIKGIISYNRYPPQGVEARDTSLYWAFKFIIEPPKKDD